MCSDYAGGTTFAGAAGAAVTQTGLSGLGIHLKMMFKIPLKASEKASGAASVGATKLKAKTVIIASTRADLIDAIMRLND